MAKKRVNSAFISGMGKHTARSFGEDIKLGDISKIGKRNPTKLGDGDFRKISGILNSGREVLEGSGMKFSEKLIVKLVLGAASTLINEVSKGGSLTSMNTVSRLSEGKNQGTRTVTHVHTGIPTSPDMKSMRKNPNIDYEEKILSSSNKDYQRHDKRKSLNLETGFNQKGICFLMEDTYLTMKQLMDFFEADPRVQEGLEKTTNGKRNLYGCVYKTITKFTFINAFSFYNVAVTLSIVKITNMNDDVRSLVYEITNNRFNPVERDENDDYNDNPEPETPENLRGKVKEKIKETAEDLKKGAKEKLQEEFNKRTGIKIGENKTKRGSPYGKINEDDQYSDPRITDVSNRITMDFVTSLNCKLTDSVQFNDRAKIVHSWYRVLGPNSIWDFTMECHMGKGVHLNYLYDMKEVNEEHPSGYIFVLECLGDSRAAIVRKKDGDHFYGYAPSRVHVDFEHKLAYLSQCKNGEDIPAVWRNKRKESDFEEGSEFQKTFCPDREPNFQTSFDNIEVSENANKKSKTSKEYELKYEGDVSGGGTSLLENIKSVFDGQGFDITNLTEDDYRFNAKNEPSGGKEVDDDDEKMFGDL
jgi:hypothetical protein